MTIQLKACLLSILSVFRSRGHGPVNSAQTSNVIPERPRLYARDTTVQKSRSTFNIQVPGLASPIASHNHPNIVGGIDSTYNLVLMLQHEEAARLVESIARLSVD